MVLLQDEENIRLYAMFVPISNLPAARLFELSINGNLTLPSHQPVNQKHLPIDTWFRKDDVSF